MKRKLISPRALMRQEWRGDIIYFVGSESIGRVKIGKSSSSSFLRRVVGLQTGFPGRLNIFGVMRGGLKDERRLHRTFKRYRVWGEWFVISDEIMEFIQANTCAFILKHYSKPKRRTKSQATVDRPTRKEINAALKEYFEDGPSVGLDEIYEEFKSDAGLRKTIEKIALDYRKTKEANV